MIQLRILITYCLPFTSETTIFRTRLRKFEKFNYMHCFMRSYFETSSQFDLIGKPLETQYLPFPMNGCQKCEFEALENPCFIPAVLNFL